jgi:hypothetical protein
MYSPFSSLQSLETSSDDLFPLDLESSNQGTHVRRLVAKPYRSELYGFSSLEYNTRKIHGPCSLKYLQHHVMCSPFSSFQNMDMSPHDLFWRSFKKALQLADVRLFRCGYLQLGTPGRISFLKRMRKTHMISSLSQSCLASV